MCLIWINVRGLNFRYCVIGFNVMREFIMHTEDKTVVKNIVKTLAMIVFVAFFLIYVSMGFG